MKPFGYRGCFQEISILKSFRKKILNLIWKTISETQLRDLFFFLLALCLKGYTVFEGGFFAKKYVAKTSYPVLQDLVSLDDLNEAVLWIAEDLSFPGIRLQNQKSDVSESSYWTSNFHHQKPAQLTL